VDTLDIYDLLYWLSYAIATHTLEVR